MRLDVSLAAALLASLATAAAAAAPPRQARLVLESCASGALADAELRRVLAIELAASGISLTSTSTAVELFVTVNVLRCAQGGPEVELVAVVPQTAEGAAQTLALGDQAAPAAAAARVVALALSELVRGLGRREPPPPPVVTAAPVVFEPSAAWEEALISRAVERARPSAPPAPLEPDLKVFLGVDGFVAVASSLASLGVELPVFTSSSVRVDAGVTGRFGLERDLRGEIELATVGGTIALRPRLLLERLELSAGPRVLLGVVSASGRPGSSSLSGRRISGLLSEVWVDLLLRWPISERWSIGGRAAAGYVLTGLAAQVDGADATGALGAALSFACFTAVAF